MKQQVYGDRVMARLDSIKELCNKYIDDKAVLGIIDRFMTTIYDAGLDKYYSYLIQVVLALLRTEIRTKLYEEYVKCIDEANSIINELEIESQR